MQTERLYFVDAYRRRFVGRVVARAERQGRPAVALDQTAFYPEGGGQPADAGRLNASAVLDVQAEGELIWHMLEQPLDDAIVDGEIDWGRRFDYMQQHHGQHLLSAAFEQLWRLPTVSVHLGVAAATIDLAATALTTEQVVAAEELVNQVIWEDRPVLARFVSASELATMTLRKPPAVDGPVRVVSVPDFDHSACGGTHPRTTGGVGSLHIRRWERRGDTVRVEFLCGGRALRDLRWKNAVLARVAAGLSINADELEAAITRLRESEERTRKQLAAAAEQLIGYEARELLAHAEQIGPLLVVRAVFANRSLDDVRALAQTIAAAGGVALLGLRAEKSQIVFARAHGLTVDCGALLRAALTPLGGRGGGQAALAQGGLPDPELIAEALAAAVRMMRQ